MTEPNDFLIIENLLLQDPALVKPMPVADIPAWLND
jgi:hypothetical protein